MSAAPNIEMMENRLSRLFDILCERAAAGARCPTNVEIGMLFGTRPDGHTNRYFLALQERGLISVQVGRACRVVTITETGHQTAIIEGEALRPLVAEGTRRLLFIGTSMEDYDSPARRAQRMGEISAEKARVASLRVPDRTPCRICGVRGDIEHTHRRRA